MLSTRHPNHTRHMPHRQSGSLLAIGGVYNADPNAPPPAPPGAVAHAIMDDTGRIIAYCWVVPEHAGKSLLEATWSWYDRHGVTTPASALRLVK